MSDVRTEAGKRLLAEMERLNFAAGGKADPTYSHRIAAIEAEAGPLDAALAEAEAALPAGWEVSGLDRWGEGWTITYGPTVPTDPDPGSAQFGPTPAAALRALAAKLREVGR